MLLIFHFLQFHRISFFHFQIVHLYYSSSSSTSSCMLNEFLFHLLHISSSFSCSSIPLLFPSTEHGWVVGRRKPHLCVWERDRQTNIQGTYRQKVTERQDHRPVDLIATDTAPNAIELNFSSANLRSEATQRQRWCLN